MEEAVDEDQGRHGMARLVSATRAGSCGIKQLSLAGDRRGKRGAQVNAAVERLARPDQDVTRERPILGTVSPTSSGGSGREPPRLRPTSCGTLTNRRRARAGQLARVRARGWGGAGAVAPHQPRCARLPLPATLRCAGRGVWPLRGQGGAPRPDDRAALNLAAPSGSTAWPRVDLPFALPGAAARLPECVNRHRKKVVGKGDDGLAVVQHHAGSETRACGRPGS